MDPTKDNWPDAPHQTLLFTDSDSGLRAHVVLDSLVMGPAAGGVRTLEYASDAAALADARRLARTMTAKCALAGLDAGGGKAVVRIIPGMDRERAFEALGRRIESLQGAFRTSGDLGTGPADLAALSRYTRYCHADTPALSRAAARGVVQCIHACVDFKGRPSLSGLRAAVQGCGLIGSAVAAALVEAGASVRVADIDRARADEVARACGADVVDAGGVLFEDVDILAPCAVGDVISPEVVRQLKAWVVVGGANHITTDHAADVAMHERGILFVPDLISSAGAVIEGVGRTVMGLDDRQPLIEMLGDTAALVLEDAAREDAPPIDHALRRAWARIQSVEN